LLWVVRRCLRRAFGPSGGQPVLEQLDLFATVLVHRWPSGDLSWTGEAYWSDAWSPCDLEGSLPLWRCLRDHGIDARCSAVYRLTHLVHRRDLPTCTQYPCNGRRCMRR
jgi:hypothetical protein